MFPLSYSGAGLTPGPRGKPPRSLPDLDNDFFPELDGAGELERFGDMAGMFEMDFPLGLPYMDWKVISDFSFPGGESAPFLLQRAVKEMSFMLPFTQEYFILESVFLSWPNSDASSYPDTNPTGGPITPPTLQIMGSDPHRRRGLVSTGPNMFYSPIPLNHIAPNRAEVTFGRPGNYTLEDRREMIFSPRDTINFQVSYEAQNNLSSEQIIEALAWVGIGFAGRSVMPKFLQGVLRDGK